MYRLFPFIFVFLLWLNLAHAQEPIITIHTSTDTAPGHIFLATMSRPGHIPHLAVMRNNGSFFYTQPVPDGALDFKVVDGAPVYFNRDGFKYEFTDWSFTTVATATAQGYKTDVHDIQPAPEPGRYLVMIYNEFPFDMSPYGGLVTATVISLILQEIDIAGNVYFEWDSWDHLPIGDTNQSLTGQRIDYIHGNAVEYDHDGNILVSGRNLDEITKVDRQTGAVIWRLGGKANEFYFTNDTGFSFQHDIRRLGNGHLTLFDNGQASRGYSRGVEYAIDEEAKMITPTWEYTGPFAFCCGNVQRLPNGNTLINWGNAGQMTEVTPAGEVVFEAAIEGSFTYRAFRFPVWRFYFPLIPK